MSTPVSVPCHLLSFSLGNSSAAHSWSQHQGPPMIFCAGSRDHPGIVSPWSQIFSLNMECIVNFARYNEYSGEAQLCHRVCVTKPEPLPPSLPCPFRIITIILRFVIFGEFNKTLLYNTFRSYFHPKPISLNPKIFLALNHQPSPISRWRKGGYAYLLGHKISLGCETNA